MNETLNLISRYTYDSRPTLVPLDPEGLEDGDSIGEDGDVLDWTSLVAAAGFDPAHEEVVVTLLTEDWHWHRGGDLVVTGLRCEGHRFAVVPFEP
jgi:hypothetical protein